jgi:ribonuclease BN (tRNA processing enzyme)
VRLTVVGCSPAWANPDGAHSGYLVASRGTTVLLDCGPGVLPRLRASGDIDAVDAVVVSHLHLDHWGDVVPWAFGWASGILTREQRPQLWLPPGAGERMRRLGDELRFRAALEGTFDVREHPEREPFAVGGLELTALPVEHYTEPTWGIRVGDGERTIAYSADTGPTPTLVELARDADLFLCEATLAEPEPAERGHLSADEAVAAFADSGARRLLLTHRPVELPLPPELAGARDGLAVDL